MGKIETILRKTSQNVICWNFKSLLIAHSDWEIIDAMLQIVFLGTTNVGHIDMVGHQKTLEN